MTFTVYILQSEIDHSFYIGYSSDIERQLQYHNSEKSRYTSKKTPWNLVYSETFNSRSEAIKREKFLKKQRNTKFYQNLINKIK